MDDYDYEASTPKFIGAFPERKELKVEKTEGKPKEFFVSCRCGSEVKAAPENFSQVLETFETGEERLEFIYNLIFLKRMASGFLVLNSIRKLLELNR